MYKIKFQGNDYLLIGETPREGAIATPEQYGNFDISYAHLFPDGRVMRHKQQIGNREDIQFMEKLAEDKKHGE